MYFSEPYFMKNKEWYTYDENDTKRPFKLTDKAPPRAKRSYLKYYKMIDEASKPYIDENGKTWIIT